MNSGPQMPSQQPNEEKVPLTVDELQRQMVELKAKVEAAEKERERDIEKKIVDRESLIAEMKQNDELLGQANKTLEYFVYVKDAGVVESPQLEELKALVGSLEQKRDEMNEKIDAISSNPDVLGKLEDIAIEENIKINKKADAEQARNQAEIDAQDLVEQAQKDLKRQIDQVLDEYEQRFKILDALRVDQIEINARQETSEAFLDKTREELDSIFENGSEQFLVGDIRYSDSENAKQKLSVLRKKLGFFDLKSKGVIDNLLSNIGIFDQSKKDLKDRADIYNKIEESKEERVKIYEKYKQIMREVMDLSLEVSIILKKHGFSLDHSLIKNAGLVSKSLKEYGDSKKASIEMRNT